MGPGSPFAHAVTWVALLSVFGFGIVMSLIGAIKLKLAQKLSLNDAQVGKLISALLFTSLIMVLVSGPFLDKFGHRLTILLGFVITCIGILIIGNAKSYGSAALGCIVLGIGGSGLNTGGNTLIVPAINPDNPAAANNFGNVFFGLGAFLMPILVGLVLKKLPLARGLTLIAVVLVLAVVPVALATYPPINSGFEISQFFGLLTNTVVWAAGLALLFYIGLEVSMGSWITTYLKSLQFSDEKASGILSLFWITFMVGRLTASQVVQKGMEANLDPGAGADRRRGHSRHDPRKQPRHRHRRDRRRRPVLRPDVPDDRRPDLRKVPADSARQCFRGHLRDRPDRRHRDPGVDRFLLSGQEHQAVAQHRGGRLDPPGGVRHRARPHLTRA